jgi:hypothetical protein
MSDMDEEFLPLPHFPYDERPATTPLEIEECATALYLAQGDTDEAALRLKVHPLRLQRAISRSPRLQRLQAELVALLNNRVLKEYKRAFQEEDARRREWAASKLAQTAQFQSHPLAPNSQSSPQLTLAGPTRIVISWDDGSSDDRPTIDHQGSDPL